MMIVMDGGGCDDSDSGGCDDDRLLGSRRQFNNTNKSLIDESFFFIR